MLVLSFSEMKKIKYTICGNRGLGRNAPRKPLPRRAAVGGEEGQEQGECLV